ncbi:hypothetical protein HHK36_000974 [Tetracentron sinense]|uniref:Uncharacterized protein n=1 Tax=Tetracentron sinense TaxID=13715 RepID=A0A835A2T1_TETSI|nr:hypothetical protein HHK36_000974 [Tetracentron sinense]
MSIISCFMIFFFLLCLSMHACNARHLAVDKESSKHVKLSGKEVLKASVPPKVKPSSLEHLGTRRRVGGVNKESMINESWGSASTQKSIDSKGLLKEVKNYKGRISGGVQIKSFVSVSLPAPHEKRRENPGFNLDYSPPKTDPPSHN